MVTQGYEAFVRLHESLLEQYPSVKFPESSQHVTVDPMIIHSFAPNAQNLESDEK